MKIGIPTTPEVDAALAAQAAARGMGLEAYAASLLEQHIKASGASGQNRPTKTESPSESPMVGAETDAEHDEQMGRDVKL